MEIEHIVESIHFYAANTPTHPGLPLDVHAVLSIATEVAVVYCVCCYGKREK